MEVIANDGNLCGEGPHWDEQQQALYWTDIDGKRLYRYLRRERRHELVHEGLSINGFTLQRDGSFVLANPDGFWWWRPDQQPVHLAPSADGLPPQHKPPRLAFGGPDLDELYITSAALHNCLMLAPDKYNPAAVFAGGPLYRDRPGVRGRLKHRSNICRPLAL